MTLQTHNLTRYWELDVTRFLAAFSVMFLHYFARGFAQDDSLSPYHFPRIGPYAMYGYLAVNLFFMISGFVIFYSAENCGSGSAGLKRFAKSRALRLFPAYWVACTMTFVALSFGFPEIRETSIARYLVNMPMINGFIGIGGIDGVYWSLFVELRFYIIFAILIFANQLKNIQPVMAIWLLFSLLNLKIHNKTIEYLLFTEYAPQFISGCTLYLIRSRRSFTLQSFALLISSNALSLAYGLEDLHRRELHYGVDFNEHVLGYAYIAFNALFLGMGRTSGRFGEQRKRWIDAMGGVSYPLYLLHSCLGFIVFALVPPHWNDLMVISTTMLAMIIGSYLVWRFIEPPLKNTLRSMLEQALPNTSRVANQSPPTK